MLRQMTVISITALFCCGLAITQTASANVFSCNLTGYTFMGCDSYYASTQAGPNAKDYFLGQPLYNDYYGSNYGGFGWAKFDVGTTTVSSAYLVYDLVGIGAMSTVAASQEEPGYLDLYAPGDIDVADLDNASEEGAELRRTLQNNLMESGTALCGTIVMTSNGTYFVDITGLYNGWAAGMVDNNGLIFSAPDDTGSNAGKFASFCNADGTAPYISTAGLGDANHDGNVDAQDSSILAENWLAGVGNPDPENITWRMGDFNRDGQIDDRDATILAANWQKNSEATSFVPEPSALLLLAIGATIVMLPRKRRFLNNFCPQRPQRITIGGTVCKHFD